MKAGWGIGTVIAILVSAAAYLLSFVDLRGLVSLILLLCGLWTLVSAFVIVDRKDRSYYSGWGIVIAALSLTYVTSLNYTIALILLAIVALIIINVYIGKAPKMFEAATNSPAPVGDTPAASPTQIVRSRPAGPRPPDRPPYSSWELLPFVGGPPAFALNVVGHHFLGGN